MNKSKIVGIIGVLVVAYLVYRYASKTVKQVTETNKAAVDAVIAP